MITRIKAIKDIIDKLMELNRVDDAAFTVHNPVHTKLGENYLAAARKGDFSPTFHEQQELEMYCRQEHRFDAKKQRIEWGEKNRDRVMEQFNKKSFGSID